MAISNPGAWTVAAALVVVGALVIILDPGVGFLGLAMGLVGGLLLVGQTVQGAGLDVPPERRLPKKKVPLLLAVSLAGVLVVVGLFVVRVNDTSASQCLLGSLRMGSPTFETSKEANTHLAILPISQSPCPAPSTGQLRILFPLPGSFNTTAACGPGSPSAQNCPSTNPSWYVLLAGPQGQVLDGYPSQTGGDAWLGGGTSIAVGDSFDIVTSGNLTGTSTPFTVEMDLNGCDVPWCESGGTSV